MTTKVLKSSFGCSDLAIGQEPGVLLVIVAWFLKKTSTCCKWVPIQFQNQEIDPELRENGAGNIDENDDDDDDTDLVGVRGGGTETAPPQPTTSAAAAAAASNRAATANAATQEGEGGEEEQEDDEPQVVVPYLFLYNVYSMGFIKVARTS